MIDSISIAQTGLQGFEKGLRTIANNTANINTPGFKGATTQFTDMFYGNDFVIGNGNAGFGQFGYGLNTLGTSLNFVQGQLQSTGNSLDLAIDGEGFFTLRDSNGNIHYTQDGQFKFNGDGTLVSSTTGEEVMAMDSGGNLVPISIADLQMNNAQATASITFSGNLSSTAKTFTNSVIVVDSAGGSHTLSVVYEPVSGSSGHWTVTVNDGTTKVGSGTIVFGTDGHPVSGSDKISVTYKPTGAASQALTLDFSTNITSYDTSSSSTLAMAKQDGHVVGSLTAESFDATGTLVLTYSNGQTVNNKQLALAQYRSEDDVKSMGSGEFASKGSGWTIGVAGSGQFGKVQSGYVEMSNVDLSQEFTNLVVVQRGYQACSQVVSTASDMLNALYGMWSK